MAYTVKRGVAGHKVLYACEACGVSLQTTLLDAGKADKCPSCERPHTIPGAKELKQLQQTKRQREAQKQQQVRAEAAAKAQRMFDENQARMGNMDEGSEADQSRSEARIHTFSPSYRLLDIIGKVYRILGVLTPFGMIAWIVYRFAAREVTVEGWAAALYVVIQLVIGVFCGFFLYAFSEWIHSYRDIAMNTWHQRALLTKILTELKTSDRDESPE